MLVVEVLERDPRRSPAADDQRGTQSADLGFRLADGCAAVLVRPVVRESLTSEGSRVSSTLRRKPAIVSMGSSPNRTPRSIMYGKWMRPDVSS